MLPFKVGSFPMEDQLSFLFSITQTHTPQQKNFSNCRFMSDFYHLEGCRKCPMPDPAHGLCQPWFSFRFRSVIDLLRDVGQEWSSPSLAKSYFPPGLSVNLIVFLTSLAEEDGEESWWNTWSLHLINLISFQAGTHRKDWWFLHQLCVSILEAAANR